MKQHMHINRFISDRNRPKIESNIRKETKKKKTSNTKTHEKFNFFLFRSLSINCELTA